ncbi:MAG: hypothetical protein J3Q66DRAFT_287953 [Benniella sp.]|nr:MAG: hypothetical protein J3Q66DRAFT_287953 [Benniella sp.]
MEFWLQRCSICFDARLDFCLEFCRDQFCRNCFQRYVKEVVSNSWGLDVTKIKCPVCQDAISVSEWTKYVDPSTLAQYHQYNQPYRSFSRFCNECDHELVQPSSLTSTNTPREQRSRTLKRHREPSSRDEAARKIVQRFIDDYRSYCVCTTTFQQSIKVAQAARQRIVTRAESKRQTEIKRSLVQLSKQLSSLETRPEQWKELQFLHVRWLRWDLCNNCGQDLCLQCGESSHHDTKNCFGYMRSLISENNGTKDDTSTIQWKLANTNPCPNCCILIHRDDGCNKVDCMLCGHRFCWICRETWGAACGFFKCGRRPMEDAEPKLGTNEDSEAMDEDTVTGEGQVQSLAVSDGVSEEIEQDQASPGISRQDRRRRRSEDLSAMAPEKVVCCLSPQLEPNPSNDCQTAGYSLIALD